jgi:protein-tyrosine phosphatase
VRPDGSGFTLLTVCSGNICRSPLAEQLLRARLTGQAHDFVVHSAGTIADDGAAMDDTAAALSRRYHGDPDDHRSQLLKATTIASSQLVLTATRAHRSAVVQLVPRATRYTFTLNQVVRLLDVIGADERAEWRDPADLVVSLAAARGLALPPTDEEDDDVVDPYRRGLEVHERAAAEIDRDVNALVAAFADIAPTFRAEA